MTKTLTQLSPAQQAAYRRIVEEGKLTSGDGVRLATIEVLEREGFISVERTSRKTRHVTRSGAVRGGTETTWVAVSVVKDEAEKPEPKPAKKVHVATISRLVRQLMEPQGHKRANCPLHGGWAVSGTAWNMKPVALVHWAHTGTEEDGTPSNMVQRPLSDEVRQIAKMLEGRGYRLQGLRDDLNHFFVVPDGV